MNPDRRPPHAYVPGQTPRHPEGWFDNIRNTARPGMSPAELGQCAALRTGQDYLAAGFFWEAHEVLEPVWMACPKDSEERHLVQGMIQLANARLKIRMLRPKAAGRLCEIAASHLSRVNSPIVLGLEVAALRQSVVDAKDEV